MTPLAIGGAGDAHDGSPRGTRNAPPLHSSSPAGGGLAGQRRPGGHGPRRDDRAVGDPEHRIGPRMRYEDAHMVAAPVPIHAHLAREREVVGVDVQPLFLPEFTLRPVPRFLAPA